MDSQKEKHENLSDSTERKLTKEEFEIMKTHTNEGTRKEIQRVYENGRRDSEKDRTRGKFSLKSLDSSSLDTVENNTDNVQIKSDNFKNWFGDWENNPSKASKVVNEDGTPKVVYHGTDKGGFYVFDPKMSDDKISLLFLIAK